MKISIYVCNVIFFKFVFVIYYYFIDNCIVIRDDGNLNEEDCIKFLLGCLSVDYKSSKLYKCMYFFNVFILLLIGVIMFC